MKNVKPFNRSNADCVKESGSLAIRLAILRYEEIFEFYSTEPLSISIKLDSKSESFDSEEIFRMRKWKSDVAYSYQIYSREREWEEDDSVDLIVRKVKWNIEKDTQYVRQANGEPSVLDRWPSIDIQNIYLCHESIEEIMNEITELDGLIENGISLTNVSDPSWSYRDLEIMRLYDWGQIHATWSPSKENRIIEDKLDCMVCVLDNIMNSPHDNIEQMSLRYSVLPETYKKLRIGIPK